MFSQPSTPSAYLLSFSLSKETTCLPSSLLQPSWCSGVCFSSLLLKIEYRALSIQACVLYHRAKTSAPYLVWKKIFGSKDREPIWQGFSGHPIIKVYKLSVCPITLWKGELTMLLPRAALLQLPEARSFSFCEGSRTLCFNTVTPPQCLLIHSISLTSQSCPRAPLGACPRPPASVSILHGTQARVLSHMLLHMLFSLSHFTSFPQLEQPIPCKQSVYQDTPTCTYLW